MSLSRRGASFLLERWKMRTKGVQKALDVVLSAGRDFATNTEDDVGWGYMCPGGPVKYPSSLIRTKGVQKALELLSTARSFTTKTNDDVRWCYLISPGGPVKYPGSFFEPMDDYLGKKFLDLLGTKLHDVSDSSYELQDKVRGVIRSTAYSAMLIEESQDLSLANPFVIGNVGVLRGQGSIVFKCLGSSAGQENMYCAVVVFIKDLIVKYHGISSLSDLPIDLPRFFDDITSKGYDPQSIPYHATSMPSEIYADMCIAAYRLLYHELTTTKKADLNTVHAIFASIGQRNMGAVSRILMHKLVIQYMPHWARKLYDPEQAPHYLPFGSLVPLSFFPPKQQRSPPGDPPRIEVGMMLVHTMRVSAIHTVEHEVYEVVKKNLPGEEKDLTRKNALSATRAAFPNVVADYVVAFEMGLKIDDALSLQARFPLPIVPNAAALPSHAQILPEHGNVFQSLSSDDQSSYISKAQWIKDEFRKNEDLLDAKIRKEKEDLLSGFHDKMKNLDAEYKKKSEGSTTSGNSDKSNP